VAGFVVYVILAKAGLQPKVITGGIAPGARAVPTRG
jgi:hypothetical protein